MSINAEIESQILNPLFDNKFDIVNFRNFLNELLPNVELKQENKFISKEFASFIDSAYDFGLYKGEESNPSNFLKIYVVKLKKSSSLISARTIQRNLIAKFLEKGLISSALVAFYDDFSDDWRLSFVKVAKQLVRDKNNNLTTQVKLSPPKRFSFLVGGEKNHTCKSRFLHLIDDISIPSIEDIEEVFSVESVTEEFFKEYKRLFLDLVDSLDEIKDSDPIVKEEFDNKNIKSSDFAKKLMGQIVFIYFLQKKRWLGIGKDDDWGTGPKNFLREIFEQSEADGKNFFNDVLEVLFYKGLSEDVEDNHYSLFGFRVPFLNGGLFEPINNYDWVKTDVVLKNEIFAEIFDTFDKFNFTVKEDEPLEKEVAVDPEMLGKVFENLLEIVDRKSKGAFYTPRHIVHYMCQETLINYLSTNSNVLEDDLRKFITEGDAAVNSIIRVIEEKKKYHGKSFSTIDLPNSIKENSDELDKLLKKVKIIDPAVGSGAFPVGMMNEIVRARYILRLLNDVEDVNFYDLKRETIENSLYGVDIELSATDVTKLRFWLSLIVDEESMDHIRPLPNLDNQIMCGNSLIDSYKGIDLFDDSLIVRSEQTRLSMTPTERAFNDLEAKKREYFRTTGPSTKNKLKKEIIQLKWNFIETHLKDLGKKEFIDEIKSYENSYDKPFFIWELEFSEVYYGKNPGFDIVIGNPPYVSNKGIDKEIIQYYKEIFGIRDDLYNYFFLKGFDLLKENGVLSFITPDTYLTIESKINLRKLFQKNHILEIVKMKNVFESAKVDNAIISIKKENMSDENYDICFKDVDSSTLDSEIYYADVEKFRSYPFNVFFIPNKLNLNIFSNFKDKIKSLEDDWFDKIRTSKTIEKYDYELQKYRNNLKPGDITLLGLITQGGQGLATGDNGKYVGLIEGSLGAKKTIDTRPKKLLEAIQSNNIKELSHINNINESKSFLNNKTEHEIAILFDELKQKYGKNIFGQGYLFRIISKEDIANVSDLSGDEINNGIKNNCCYVPYDKGDKQGNRWVLNTPYFLNWSTKSVSQLKSSSRARFQNSRFYFKEGFCWNNVLDTQSKFIKCRLKSKSIHDVASMSLFPLIDNITAKYLVCMLNSTFLYHYQRTFVNNTVNLQMNDFRQHPIIVPTEEQLSLFESIFDEAYDIKIKYFDGEISKKEHDNELDKIQKVLDEEVNKLYCIDI